MYKDEEMQSICSSISKASSEYGIHAKKIMRRIEELRRAPSLEALKNLPGRCHELKGTLAGQLSIDISLPFCLYFEPVGEDIYKPDNGLDWRKVYTIRILRYGKYTHD